LEAMLAVLGANDDGVRSTPRRTLARTEATAPAAMEPFAEVGGDLNPIHRSTLAARLAGLERPIVHGMWTAARLHAFVVEDAAHGEAARVRDFSVQFLAPVLPGEALRLTATRTGVVRGAKIIEAVAAVVRGGVEVPAASARLRLAPPPTAWVFPGQGIQQQDMGMAGYLRSPAARKVWDRADAHTRAHLGFSILRVVRENPREITIQGEHLTHAKGVIHLTQLTQVAMAVLAYAQVAELAEQGVYVEDAVFCGHSVGEYNALSAAAQVLPLEAVVAIVYQRGRVMHGLVPRDAHGDSGFRMGVIRPHYAGLDHAAAEALVAAVAERTGRFLEIVNYNVRGRQYSVTGHADALEALNDALEQRRRPGAKPPYVEVPGVDVPFHSRRLREGVPDFRAALLRHLPAEVDPERLVGRYIPNLVALPFALTTAFVHVVRDAVEGESRATLDAVLAEWDAWSAQPSRLARVLLVELLAWQFASPVRWITTQERMFAPRGDGGLGVRRLVEVGVGYQPTLTGMARYTLELAGAGHRVQVLNIDADRAIVFAENADPAVTAAVEVEESPNPGVDPGPAAGTAPAAAVAAPAPAAIATERPSDAALTHVEALTSLLALQAKVRADQVSPTETIDALFDGVSSRR
ncbi:MAG: 3-oxoacyl-ACP synthase, partial [Actinobacteria bacterium HGW-Actinobacteria-8]